VNVGAGHARDDYRPVAETNRGHGPLPQIVFILIVFICTPLLADYQAGLDAYNAGDYGKALDEWQQVAAAPPTSTNPAIYVETHYAIAMLYWQGQGVARDYYTAREWLLKAAKLNHAGAQAKLGYLYTDGIAVPQDFYQAFEWFSKAAKQGDVDGQYNLGIFYLNGWGTEQDTTMAAQYLAAASAQGDQAAEEALQQVLARMDSENSNRGHGPLPQQEEMSEDIVKAEEILEKQEIVETEHIVEAEQAVGADAQRHSASASSPAAKPHSLHHLRYARDISLQLKNESWILTQNPNHYTIQVIALSSLAKVESLVSEYDHLAPLATYTVQRNNNPLYVLVQGDYENSSAARLASEAIPAEFQDADKLLIRRFSGIHALIDD